MTVRMMQCLCDGCNETLRNPDDLMYHVLQVHGIPNELTTHTTMQYCYENNV
jgi:hypothetical protein